MLSFSPFVLYPLKEMAHLKKIAKDHPKEQKISKKDLVTDLFRGLGAALNTLYYSKRKEKERKRVSGRKKNHP